MTRKIYRFKQWHLMLNLLVLPMMLGGGGLMMWSGFRSFLQGSTSWLLLGLGTAAILITIEEVFKHIVPYFPRGIALELHEDFLVVASGNGPRQIPRAAVRGCKEPESVRIVGKRGGRVEVSVKDEFKIRHWTGRKVNPSFHGMAVEGQDAVTMVRAIRDWRKAGQKKK